MNGIIHISVQYDKPMSSTLTNKRLNNLNTRTIRRSRHDLRQSAVKITTDLSIMTDLMWVLSVSVQLQDNTLEQNTTDPVQLLGFTQFMIIFSSHLKASSINLKIKLIIQECFLQGT
jgi:hypothetical protein